MIGVFFNAWIIIGQLVWGKTNDVIQVAPSVERCENITAVATTVATSTVPTLLNATFAAPQYR